MAATVAALVSPRTASSLSAYLPHVFIPAGETGLVPTVYRGWETHSSTTVRGNGSTFVHLELNRSPLANSVSQRQAIVRPVPSGRRYSLLRTPRPHCMSSVGQT